MEQCTEWRPSKWRDEGKAFFEIRSGFQEKAAFFGVSAPASPSSTRSITALAKAHLQLFSSLFFFLLLFTPPVNHPERVVDAPPGASVSHQMYSARVTGEITVPINRDCLFGPLCG
jgi:hypothetical protein